jgi:hypothetical protein
VQDRQAGGAAGATPAVGERSTPTLAVTRLAHEMGLLLRAGRVLLCATVIASATPACYSAGGGTSPPTNKFYFPVGLATSAGGQILYAVNSDFDLQWSGGTLQSYDLASIRRDAAAVVVSTVGGQQPVPPDIPWVGGHAPAPGCAMGIPSGVALGQGCAPPVDSSSTRYWKESAVIGAFATDLQLLQTGPGPQGFDRLFFPVRGNASLTWANVTHDDGMSMPVDFSLQCSQDSSGRCGVNNEAGNNSLQPGDTREVTMPGEPFGMAVSQDGTAVAITHQTDTKTSLLLTGLVSSGGAMSDPSMQFVLDGLPVGGNGIYAVPHDYDAATFCDDPRRPPAAPGAIDNCIRPAFLQTSRAAAQLDLLRYYDDHESTIHRPFLTHAGAFSLTANSVGSDSRGIVIDPTPRLACKARLYAANPNAKPSAADLAACGKRPARVFFANRSPPSVVVGEIGELAGDGSYDPDAFSVTANVPVTSGPSRVYLAPIIDENGILELRLFVVCFDSAAIFIYDPDDLQTYGTNATPKNVIYTGSGTGPFAMAFDPMPVECVALGDPTSPLWGSNPLLNMKSCPPVDPMTKRPSYRFGYIANFTKSFVQVIDLDDYPQTNPYAYATFEEVVFTLGNPTLPKGQ